MCPMRQCIYTSRISESSCWKCSWRNQTRLQSLWKNLYFALSFIETHQRKTLTFLVGYNMKLLIQIRRYKFPKLFWLFIFSYWFQHLTFRHLKKNYELEQSASSIDNEGKEKDLLSRILHNVVHTVVFEVWVGEVEDGHGGVWPHLESVMNYFRYCNEIFQIS